MSDRTDRLPELDGLRGWAAVSVFVWHALDVFAPVVVDTHVGAGAPHPLLAAARSLPVGAAFNGTFAVALFFALSGYVLTHQLYAGNLFARAHELIARRWLRLLPVVAVGSAAGWAVLRFGWFGVPAVAAANGQTNPDIYSPAVFDQLTPWAWARQTFGTVWAAQRLELLYNRVLWTIGVEFQCSVLVYAGVTLFRGVRNRAFAHAVTGFAGVCLIGPDYLPFAVGVGLAERRLAADPPARGGALLGWLLVLAACWCGGVHPTPHRDWWLPFAALLPPPLAFDTAVKVLYTLGAGLLLNAALTFPPLTAALRTRASQFLGYVSYPVYAVHQPLLYSVAAAVCVGCLPAVGYTAAAVLGVAAAAVASVGLAWAVARYVDAPFNRWVKKAVTRAMNQRWGPPAAGDRAGGADVAATTPPPAARAEPPAVSAGGR